MGWTSYPSLERRRAFCETAVTLNGAPARVSGYRRDFATVTDKATGLSAEWAWTTVRFIIDDRDGAFRS